MYCICFARVLGRPPTCGSPTLSIKKREIPSLIEREIIKKMRWRRGCGAQRSCTRPPN